MTTNVEDVSVIQRSTRPGRVVLSIGLLVAMAACSGSAPSSVGVRSPSASPPSRSANAIRIHVYNRTSARIAIDNSRPISACSDSLFSLADLTDAAPSDEQGVIRKLVGVGPPAAYSGTISIVVTQSGLSSFLGEPAESIAPCLGVPSPDLSVEPP